MASASAQYNVGVFMKLLISAVGVVFLNGCMSAAYVVGEVKYAFDEKYNQNAVVAINASIDGLMHQLRAKVGCSSFIHPMTGRRTTRNKGELFKFQHNDGGVAFLKLAYSCREEDAGVILSESKLIQIYRVVLAPSIRIVMDLAIPESHPASVNAPVVLFGSSLEEAGEGVGLEVVTSIPGALKQMGVSRDDVRFMAVYSGYYPLNSPYIVPEDAQELRALSASQSVRGDVFMRMRSRINKAGPYQAALSTHLAFALSEIEFLYSFDDDSFSPWKNNIGRRTYYPIKQRDCTGKPCQNDVMNFRVGSYFVTKHNAVGMAIYDYERQVVYFPWYESL